MTENNETRPLVTFALFAYNQERFIRWLARRRTGLRWSTTVKRDFLLLLAAAVLVAATGHWNDWLGAAVGLVVAVIAGLLAIIRLAHMAELGGRPGKLAHKARLYLVKGGLIHREKKHP